MLTCGRTIFGRWRPIRVWQPSRQPVGHPANKSFNCSTILLLSANGGHRNHHLRPRSSLAVVLGKWVKIASPRVATLVSAGVAGFSIASVNAVTPGSALSPAPSKHNFSKVMADADALLDDAKYEELYDLLVQYKDEDDAEIKWRLARAAYKMSKLSASKTEKVKLLQAGQEYAYRALELNPQSYQVHKWVAILVIERAEQDGTKAKIEKSILSKEHMLRAHELAPKDGTLLYMLGLWCYSFADLSWTQRKLASVIFATPPTSTFEEALEYFEKAESSAPNFYSKNLLMLGKTYLKLKDSDKGVAFLKRARDYPVKTIEDKEAHKEASELLTSLRIS